MVIALFQIDVKGGVSCFFKEIFLLLDISINIVFWMLFLNWGNIKINFNNQKVWWRLYIAGKALSTTKKVELVEKKEFRIAALDLEN